ncbi:MULTISPECIES: (2,3-dihydroxybenzoyl)adenylate synthase [Nocardia]|uniref:(2,3-dihydroxybenzoyl)adenylate synthase n=1 Tax=Nocardia TaxID=1817 RepID=UPI00135C219B|nr:MULTISPECIES: AMP-binding protein [Nocardia]
MKAHGWNGRLVPFPADRAAAYRASGEWSELPITARLHESALRHADRIALITAEATYTYRELDERTDRIAAGLARLGLQRLNPVIFQVTNRASTVLAWYGVLKAGLIPVATLAQHRRNEIGQISEKVGAVAHLVEAGLSFDLVGFARAVGYGHPSLRQILSVEAPAAEPGVHRIEDLGTNVDPAEARTLVETIEAETDPEDVAVFQLSGGTTGVPKVIPRIHAEYWNNGVFYARTLGWDEQTRVAHLLPVIHNAGISCALHAAHAVGATLVLATPKTEAAFDLMARSAVTDVLIGHGHYQAVASAEFDPVLHTVRRTVLSGAKVPAELFGKLDGGRSHWAGQMFGMSEGMFIVTPPDAPAAARAATVGLPIAPSDEILILEPGGEQELPAGVVGELCCRGPYTIPGYFGAPEHNANAFTSDGFYRTGDLAALHEFGGRRYVAIEGRIKDLINRGGEKVNAEEIELLLVRHPDIVAAAVVAMPDERLGEKACAFLVSASGDELTMATVQEHMDALGVAKFKWPERLVWVSELPRTNVGKVNKKVLRADIVERLAAESLEGAQ